MSESIKVRSIRLAHHFKKDTIDVSHVEHPHGDYSDPVVELDIMIDGEQRQKVEIPYDNIEEVIEALKKAKEVCKSIPHSDVHGDLLADLGGGE